MMTFEEWYAECAHDVLADWGSEREVAALLPYEINAILEDAYSEYRAQEQEYLDMQLAYSQGLGG